MTDKELIDKEIKKFPKGSVVKNLVLLKGLKEATVRTALHRGSITKEIAVLMEEVTSTHAMFWMEPNKYDQKGNRRLQKVD